MEKKKLEASEVKRTPEGFAEIVIKGEGINQYVFRRVRVGMRQKLFLMFSWPQRVNGSAEYQRARKLAEHLLPFVNASANGS